VDTRPRYRAAWAAASGDGAGWAPMGNVWVGHFEENSDTRPVDMTRPLQNAVAWCAARNVPLHWQNGSIYPVNDNIPDIHNVTHVGQGRVVVDGKYSYHINPLGTDTQINHVSPAGSSANDGMSPLHPSTINAVWGRMKLVNSGADGGRYRIQMAAGTYTETGVVIADWPYFRNELEIFGPPAEGGVPTAIWDGTGNSQWAAIRGGLTNSESGFLNLYLKDIKFINSGEAGFDSAVLYWYNGRIKAENLHAENIIRPFDYRGIRLDQFGGTIANAGMGIRANYQCNSNIGGLRPGESITFDTCDVGVSISRGGIAYIENCVFTGASSHNITVSQYARMRTQRNTFGGFSVSAIRNDNGIWDGPKSADLSETYPSLSEGAPAYSAQGTASIQNIAVLGQRFMHVRSGRTGGTNTFSISGRKGQLLLSDADHGGSDWVPLRLPAYTLYSPTLVLEVEMELAFTGAHGGGLLALHGQGSGSGVKLAELEIGSRDDFARGTVRMKFINNPGRSSGSYECVWTATGDFNNNDSAQLDNPAIRSSSDKLLLFRLYWTPRGPEEAVFSNLVTYITA